MVALLILVNVEEDTEHIALHIIQLINKIEFRLISRGGSLTWLDLYRHDHTWGNHHQ
jgi:hypothetical protein